MESEALFEAFGDLLIGDEDFDPDGFGDLGTVMTADGCIVEPDGRCPHGKPSPLVRLALI